ncbi:peptidoglycan editing factor PgeF [Bradyrhizobium sp. LHD-71]|uniref:peptidoglycan editing factor PgeF n=1 Tax=Bradyrhizobium sp. LHD-71 TaxID=3072141 RepID=UPI00280C4416|nr:peptidoglycan editing factor PgeF [Bradyrhizobium sp. LHD-71]MDQ8729032.1 peptidoglycan editing factor PgeF [Bradyrhizobium sp. LHD-71]
MTVESLLLSSVPGIRHAFFTRAGGVSSGIYAGLNGGIGSQDEPDKVQENRRRMAAALDVPPEKLLTLHQIHSPDVVVATEPWPLTVRPKGDAMVTKVPGIALGVTTADCAPVLMVDPKARVIGAAHAGWKGALGGVLEATIDSMEGQGASRGDIVVGLGPMLRQRNYEVGMEFVARFQEAGADNERFFSSASRHGHAMFDLPGYIHARLHGAGILMVDDVDLCTYADEDSFFSYRRSTHRKEADYGRHVHAIVLED